MKNKIFIPICICSALLCFILSSYNKMVTLDQRSEGKWAQIAFQYEKQSLIIEQLIEKGCECSLDNSPFFEELMDARHTYLFAPSLKEKKVAIQAMHLSLNRFMLLTFDHKELKDKVNPLMKQLEDIDKTLNGHTYEYNEMVDHFNTMIRHFPTAYVARISGFKPKTYIETPLCLESHSHHNA